MFQVAPVACWAWSFSDRWVSIAGALYGVAELVES